MGFFSKDIKTLDDLFVHTLQDIYYAEKQIAKALPKMIDKATDPQLKAGFEKHLQETEGHIERRRAGVRDARREGQGASTARPSTASSRRPTRSPATSTTSRCWMPR